MGLTHAEIEARLEEVLWDTTDTYWSDIRIISKMGAILKKISQRVPFVATERHPSDRAVPTRGTYTTDGTTRDIVLTDWDFDDLIKISQFDGVEYLVDQSPKEYKNFSQRDKIISLSLDDIPSASKTVYVYPQRLHILQQAIGTTDTAGAIKTLAAAAATSLALKSLGTGTINKYTKLTIAGDTTEYMVTATATIAANEATVTITPGLVAAAAVDAVVTLALADSTLTPSLEEIIIGWTAGELLSDYGIKMLSELPIEARHTDYTQKGELMIKKALEDLKLLERPGRYIIHPKS